MIEWEGLAFHVVDLPGHARHPVGFLLKLGDKPLAFFTGDLLRAPACLVNMYDLENTYVRHRAAGVARRSCGRPRPTAWIYFSRRRAR